MAREGTFTEFMPKMEIEGGNVVMHVGRKQRVVLVPVHIFERFLLEGEGMVAQWRASHVGAFPIRPIGKREKEKRRKH